MTLFGPKLYSKSCTASSCPVKGARDTSVSTATLCVGGLILKGELSRVRLCCYRYLYCLYLSSLNTVKWLNLIVWILSWPSAWWLLWRRSSSQSAGRFGSMRRKRSESGAKTSDWKKCYETRGASLNAQMLVRRLNSIKCKGGCFSVMFKRVNDRWSVITF